jgi:hypothetical protein
VLRLAWRTLAVSATSLTKTWLMNSDFGAKLKRLFVKLMRS